MTTGPEICCFLQGISVYHPSCIMNWCCKRECCKRDWAESLPHWNRLYEVYSSISPGYNCTSCLNGMAWIDLEFCQGHHYVRRHDRGRIEHQHFLNPIWKFHEITSLPTWTWRPSLCNASGEFIITLLVCQQLAISTEPPIPGASNSGWLQIHWQSTDKEKGDLILSKLGSGPLGDGRGFVKEALYCRWTFALLAGRKPWGKISEA